MSDNPKPDPTPQPDPAPEPAPAPEPPAPAKDAATGGKVHIIGPGEVLIIGRSG